MPSAEPKKLFGLQALDEYSKENELLDRLQTIIRDEGKLKISPCEGDILLRCLRTKKYNMDNAVKLVYKYFEFKKFLLSEIGELKPTRYEKFIRKQMILPGLRRDSKGRLIVYIELGKWEPKLESYEDILICWFMATDEISKSLDVQLNGVVVVIDYKGIGWYHLRQFTMQQIKFVAQMAQDCFPIHVDKIHIINHPGFVHMIYSLLKPMLKPEVHEQMVFHRGKLCDTLHKWIDPEILPNSVGGKLTSQEYCDISFLNSLLSKDDYYKKQSVHLKTNCI